MPKNPPLKLPVEAFLTPKERIEPVQRLHHVVDILGLAVQMQGKQVGELVRWFKPVSSAGFHLAPA